MRCLIVADPELLVLFFFFFFFTYKYYENATVKNNNRWVGSSEKMSSNTCEMCKFRSFCEFAQPHTCLWFPFEHSTIYKGSVGGQRRLRADCADAQSDQSPRCPYLPEDTFPCDMTHIAMLPIMNGT